MKKCFLGLVGFLVFELSFPALVQGGTIPSYSPLFASTSFQRSQKNGLTLHSTYLGGSATDDGYEPAMVMDRNGFIYVTGYTRSLDFPTTPGAFQETFSGMGTDRFITKYTPDLKTIVASTYLGGKGNETGMGIALDPEGHVYVAGYTSSSNFPTTDGCYDATPNGKTDVFVCMLSSDLSTLLASTLIGGSGEEGYDFPRIDMAIGPQGSVYVTGLTLSSNFPVTSQAFETKYQGSQDIFVCKLNAALTQLQASTYFGSSRNEWRPSIILDPEGNVYISGDTNGNDFPSTIDAYGPTYYGGGYDIFISRLSSDLSTLKNSTFFGTDREEDCLAMRWFKESVIVVGYTNSTRFPKTEGCFAPHYRGGDRDAIISRFSADLKELQASTYFGGSLDDVGQDLFIDNQNRIHMVGHSTSMDLTMLDMSIDADHNGGEDAFYVCLDWDLSVLLDATYLGGSRDERGQCILVDPLENVVLAGRTNSLDFPTNSQFPQPGFQGGDGDCFVARMEIGKANNESNRWVTHLTRKGSVFGSQIIVNNLSAETQELTLVPYTEQGVQLLPLELNLQAEEKIVSSPFELFKTNDVSHFRIQGSDSIKVSLSYALTSGHGASAHVNESTDSGLEFAFFPGQWDKVFDGMAIVNLSDTVSTVTVSQIQFDTVGTHDIDEISLEYGPYAKQLLVFADYFDAVENSQIRVRSSELTSLLFLRGTYADVNPGYLYQTRPIRMDENDLSQRWLPHVTPEDAVFETMIWISNFSSEPSSLTLVPFSKSGEQLSAQTFSLGANHILKKTPFELFQQSDVSHFMVESTLSHVTLGYQLKSGIGATGHVTDSDFRPVAAQQKVIVYPGEWDQIFDGMAWVNLSDQPAKVRAIQLDPMSKVVKDELIIDALQPNEKALVVFDSFFNDLAGCQIQFVSDQQACILFLRGTFPGVDPGFLYQVLPVGNEMENGIILKKSSTN